MQVVKLTCPHCSARLKLRDLSFVGRTIHCPDCALPLTIVRNAAGKIEATPREKTTEGVPAPRESKSTASGDAEQPLDATSPRRPPKLVGRNAQHIAWGLAAVLLVSLVVFALTGGEPVDIELPETDVLITNDDGGEPDPPTPDVEPAMDERDTVRRQLGSLAEWVIDYRNRHGHFPVENPLARDLPPDERLGWLAAVAASGEPNGPQPLWDRPLNDPLNSRFVRRKMEPFLNPSTANTASDGLPASHYVGVAGVGEDAASRPKNHSRAGIFGVDRRTTVEDIRDGLTNTLLIVGTVDHPVPWAAGGDRTMRPFTKPPYVNGPDGFGTGQPDGMFVAMADGSVRFVSSKTDPTVWRRMAAMADGLPLDPAVPGEPGQSPPAGGLAGTDGNKQPAVPDDPQFAAHPANGPDGAGQDDKPIAALVAPDRKLPPPPNYDVERALGQPIVRFSQVRAVPFRDLLQQLRDLAGVPVRWADPQDPRVASVLAREVSVEMRETTYGEVLAQLLAQVGVSYESGREFGIRLLIAE